MSSQAIPYPWSHDIDREADIADKRYARALAQVTVYDVLAVACQMLSEWDDYRTHPLYQLARHVLKHGSYKRSGKHPYFADRLSTALEDVCDEAVERLVSEQLAYDEQADLALDLE
jgi:hypothetical protein